MQRRRSFLLAAVIAIGGGALLGGAAQVSLAYLTAQSSNGGNTFTTAASFPNPIAFVKTIGSSSCGTTTSVITVPAAGVAAGNTVIVRWVGRGTTTGALSATDTKGNAYSVDREVLNTDIRTVVLSAHVATALTSGNTITVTHPNTNAKSAVAVEFSGVAATGRVHVSNTGVGSSATPTASVTTTTANTVLVGAQGNLNALTVTQPASWTNLGSMTTACGGGGAGTSSNNGAYRIVSATGTYAYAPTLSGSQRWSEVVVAYRSQ